MLKSQSKVLKSQKKILRQGRTEWSVHRTRTEARHSVGARHDWSKKLLHFERKLVCHVIHLPACSAILSLDFKNCHASQAQSAIYVSRLEVSSDLNFKTVNLIIIYINDNSLLHS